MYNFSYPLSLKDPSSPVSIFLFPRLTLQPALELTFEAQVGVPLHRVCRGVHGQLSERQGPPAVSYLSVLFMVTFTKITSLSLEMTEEWKVCFYLPCSTAQRYG